MNRRPIVIALIASVVIAALMWKKIQPKAPKTIVAPVVEQPTIPKVSVVVCKKRIPSRTQLDAALIKETLEVKDVLASSVPPLAFTSVASITNRYTSVTILPGDIMTPQRVMSGDQIPNLARAVPKGKRAVSIAVSKETSVGGFIQQGDYVDVIATFRPKNGDPITKIVLQDIQVLAAGDTYEFDDAISTSTPSISASKMKLVTLAVTPEELEKLIYLDSGTQFRLVLKNPEDKDKRVYTKGATERNLLKSTKAQTIVQASVSSQASSKKVDTYVDTTDDGRVEIMYGADLKRQIYKYGGPAANKFRKLPKSTEVYSPPSMADAVAEENAASGMVGEE